MSTWLRLRFLLGWPPPARGAPLLPIPSGYVRMDGRRVRVRAFELDERPVTNAEYLAFIQSTGRPRPPWMHRPGFGEPEQPVVGVTYDDARAYARWAGKRLPTEAEWVRAARGDDERTYPWGDVVPQPEHAHFRRGSRGAPADVTRVENRGPGRGPYGHRDLAGNVWEWCSGRVLKGGFWGSGDVKLDARLVERAGRASGGIGLRCAR